MSTLTVDPQSPSPTLLSHSFKLSLRFITAVAAASIATSRIRPSGLSCWGRLDIYPKVKPTKNGEVAKLH